MKTISNIQELNLPYKHRRFIEEFLRQAQQIETFDKIDKFILFGSCARGNATIKSDVDIFVTGDGIGDETLFDLYDCTWYPEMDIEGTVVNNDVFVDDIAHFKKCSDIIGTFEWRVARDGVILNELLQSFRRTA
jgi:predicted nucleotidyltransferase